VIGQNSPDLSSSDMRRGDARFLTNAIAVFI
jgi:hypothetical protein